MATIRQKKAVDILVENQGKSVSGAMREAGYPATTAKNPQNLTKSKGFAELLDQYLPEDKLLRYLGEDLEKKGQNRKAELELAFKLRGKLTERVDHTTKGKELPTPILGGTSVHSDDSNSEDTQA